MFDFLPEQILCAVKNLNAKKLYEIRLRAGEQAIINYDGVYTLLSNYGPTSHTQNAVFVDKDDIADCVFKAGNYSVYAVEEQLKRGFITTNHGIRIGIAGEFVTENGQIIALKNFSSLCIRIPHEIIGCGQEIYDKCLKNRLYNLLIVSPPGLGKTTILRDIARLVTENTNKNILICDERGEIAQGKATAQCDILRFCDKTTAFEIAIRTLRPEIMITDELSAKDCQADERAVSAGICVIASAHFYDIKEIKVPFFGLFQRYAVLDRQTIGKVKNIYNERGEQIL